MDVEESTKIAVISADPALCHVLGEGLAAYGMAAVCGDKAEAAADARAALCDGVSYRNAVRAAYPRCEAILIGADGFPKPLRVGRLIALALDCLQRGDRVAEIVIGDSRIDPVTGLLVRDGAEDAQLTEKERELLMLLLASKGRTVDRKTLLEKIWGYGAAIETHTLETHIYRLRQKIETDPAAPVFLVTDGSGYLIKL